MSFDEKSIYEQSRWLSLFHAVNLIDQKCSKTGRILSESLLKPIPIRKYIDQISPGVEEKIKFFNHKSS